MTMQTKKTICIGNHLFLVEGARHWALYDLIGRTGLGRILPEEAKILVDLSQSSVALSAKKTYLQRYASKLMAEFLNMKIEDRLFQPDTLDKGKTRPPCAIYFEITEKCNQRCIHCYAKGGPECLAQMLPEFAKAILREGAELGFYVLKFTGGEPFMHPDFRALVEYARELYFNIEICTNLTLATEEDLKWIKELGVSISTTCFGHNANLYDEATSVKGSFERWYKNIKLAKHLGIPCRITTILMRHNEAAKEEIERFLRQEGLVAAESAFRSAIVDLLGRGNNLKILPQELLPDFVFRFEPIFFHFAREFNSFLRGELAVTAEGIVLPCVFCRDVSVSDLRKEPLGLAVERLWDRWMTKIDQIEKCRDCEWRYACYNCTAYCVKNIRGNTHACHSICKYNPYKAEIEN